MTFQNQHLQRNNDSLIQLQQKNIHYRSEISRLNLLIEKYEKQLQVNKGEVERLKEQLQFVESEKNDVLNKSVTKPIAFFNYSVILPELSNDDEAIIVGNFTIRNIGNTPLSYPTICLKITPQQVAGKLAGKIRYRTNVKQTNEIQILEDAASEEWIFVDRNWQEKVLEKGEYWLKPTHKSIIPPNEELHFSMFELALNIKEARTLKINGFAYFEQLTEGITALNTVQIT